MKRLLLCALLLATSTCLLNATIKIVALKGSVSVRHNVNELWVNVAPGDVLKPEDSMKLGKKSSATILTDGGKKLVIPELVIIDLSDLRSLTQEELLLKLAMERVRSVPTKTDEELKIPLMTTTHGGINEDTSASAGDHHVGVLQLNGTQVLFNQGYYATCVLKAKEVFRQYPYLSSRMVDSRIMVAAALEKMKLNGEALTEYHDIAAGELSPQQRDIVESKIARLKKNSE